MEAVNWSEIFAMLGCPGCKFADKKKLKKANGGCCHYPFRIATDLPGGKCRMRRGEKKKYQAPRVVINDGELCPGLPSKCGWHRCGGCRLEAGHVAP